jgi:hypothetical protein
VSRRRLLQQAVERLALLLVERAEDVVLGRCERQLDLAQPGAPGVGELDRVAPAILVRAAPQRQAGALELVQQADEVRAVDPERARERLLRRAAVIAQQRQRDEVPRAQPERGERGLVARPREPRKVVEQGRRAMGGRLRGDGRIVERRRPGSSAINHLCNTNE